MNVLSLFSGIGMHELGLEWAGMTLIGQCEIESYCLNVLRRHWPDVPRWRDVRHVNRASIIERCGCLPAIITGGSPCQQISNYNNVDRQGVGSKSRPTLRSGLVWHMLRIIAECEPRWILLENVPCLRVQGVDDLLNELERTGYSCWPLVVGAEHVGAPHKRHRVWIVGCRLGDTPVPEGIVSRALAYAHREYGDLQFGADVRREPPSSGAFVGEDLYDSSSPRICQREDAVFTTASNHRWPAPRGWPQQDWESPRGLKPGLGGGANGRSKRLAALGNCNPPQVVEAIGRAIMRIDAELAGESATRIVC